MNLKFWMLDKSLPNPNTLNHFVFFKVLSRFGDAALRWQSSIRMLAKFDNIQNTKVKKNLNDPFIL